MTGSGRDGGTEFAGGALAARLTKGAAPGEATLAATGVRATLQEIEDGLGRGAAEAAGLAR
jgi:hypothetical protein